MENSEMVEAATKYLKERPNVIAPPYTLAAFATAQVDPYKTALSGLVNVMDKMVQGSLTDESFAEYQAALAAAQAVLTNGGQDA